MFPRKNLFQASLSDQDIKVILPTKEEITFDKESNTLLSGVFEECSPIHMGKSVTRFNRHWPQVKYHGNGLIIRVNARGQFPEISNWNKTKIKNFDQTKSYEEGFSCIGNIGHIGADGVYIFNGSTQQSCVGKKSDFWTKTQEGGFIFKFHTDEQLDKFLIKECGFGIPKI